MGRQKNVVQKFTRIQSFGKNWWWAYGIRVEHLPRIHHIAAQPQSPRVAVKIERNIREIYWTGHLHVDVQRLLMGISGQQERMRVKCSTRFSLCKEIRSRTMVILGAWIRGRSGTLSVKTVHKEKGTELKRKWCWDLQKVDTQSSEPRVHCAEECLRAKVGEIVDTLWHRLWHDWNCFSHTSFCKSAQSLRVQSQKCVNNTNLVTMERRDPLWEDNLVHRSCQVWSRQTYLRMMILYTQNFYCKEKENELKKFSQQDRLSKLVTDAEFLAAVEVGQYFMTKDTEEFSQLTDSVACREYTMPRDAEASEPKGWIRGNTKIGPVLEVTTCCL